MLTNKPEPKQFVMPILIFILIVFFMSISTIVKLITDYWWFQALNFEQIFLISLKAKLFLFLITASIFFVFAILNLIICSFFNKTKIKFKLKLLITLIISILIGAAYSQNWFSVLQYLNQTPFNLQDPIFFKDVAFYIFSLPFILTAWKFAITVIVITAILITLDYLSSALLDKVKQPKVIDPEKPQQKPDLLKQLLSNNKAVYHVFILGSIFFALLAIYHYVSRFSIMYSEAGIVVGAGYTDVHIFLPILKLLSILAIIIALFFYVWIFYISKHQKIRKRHILMYIVIVYLLTFFIAPSVIPGIVQSLKVSPNEMNLEQPFIENNIRFTRIAYNLDNVEEIDFDVQLSLTPEILENETEIIDNIRILDWRPLTQTYKQTQEIRLYYDLSEIDIDRYNIDGKYTQVLLSARELDQQQIAENAKTWVNLHEVYTHGFGVVMSPVNAVTDQGLPNYLIKDIPPTTEEPILEIDNPRIYYGEKDNDYVLVNTKTDEFDYPKGNTNEYINYDGNGGIVLDTFTKKLLMAIRFMDIKILLSTDITSESKIMFNRNIQDRISKITPFLLLDEDPYLVINEGKLFWIQDAYTISGNFPYSEKIGGINYMRNPVKIIVDTYNGDVTYYIIDDSDPLMETYSNIFPEEFKTYEEFPEGLKEHIRYPEGLFKVQTYIYNDYHMDDATVFYNKEDAWETPSEVYGTGQEVDVEPYYIITKLPEEETEEFILMTSFTPLKKDNMIAWMAARSDGDNYGKLLLYKFSKDKLVYGPLQIEAKFDQDSEISQQLTLWSQQGSRVTRGNLLVIPIKDSILYIEPLYIQAETGQLPELKRVLVSDGERVVMEID